MLKRIIFDQDNTLMIWYDKYDETYKYALDELGISYDEKSVKELIDVVCSYEGNFDYFNKKAMVDFINENCVIKVPDSFMDVWLNYLCDCYSEEDKKIIPTLDYLSKKYELVVLSNWFGYSQKERLKHIGMYKYFKDMVFTENTKMKPNKEAFLTACGPYKPEECLMIGDGIDIDINGAINAGLEAMLFDPNDKYEYKNKIKDIKELEELL